MMNSQLIHATTAARGKTILAELLKQGRSDDEILTALYQRVLGRKPTDHERGVCRRYLARVGNRAEALEDILWSLVNSTEFLLKR